MSRAPRSLPNRAPMAADADVALLRAELAELRGLMETVLATVQGAAGQEWLRGSDFIKLVGLRNTRSLHYYLAQGCFGTDSIRNVGTIKRPRYLFHRKKALDQFMRRNT